MANFEENIRTPSQNIVSTQGGRLFIDEAKGRMILYDGTVNRLILGILPDGTIGMIVSKPGIDVFSLFS